MRQTRIIMGMPVQLEICDESASQNSYDRVFEYLAGIDERFSTYKDTSEIGQINQGEKEAAEYSKEMKEIFALSKKTSEETNGYFDITTLSGSIDPSGIVKGWAISNAADLLTTEGYHNFYLEIAGDIHTSGHNAEGKEWSIGVRNPFAREEVVKVIYPHGKGIATSGNYVRGSHIYNPHDVSVSPADFTSFTVLGPSVYDADRFATAAFAMGEKGLYFIEALEGYEAYAIDHKGIARMTSGFEEYTKI
jgi:thiamine biosynthesis lipoprotein